MRLGPLEIGITLLVVLLVLVVMRVARPPARAADCATASSSQSQERRGARRQGKASRSMLPLGGALVVGGILLMFGGISLFRWAAWSYLWAFVAVSSGLAAIFLSRRR